MSNMNGGLFKPHKSHQRGNDVDGYFSGYRAMNANTAKRLIECLNDPKYGSRISNVYVTFKSKKKSDPFYRAIKDVVLEDGRRAADIIVSVAGHAGHFHWVIVP